MKDAYIEHMRPLIGRKIEGICIDKSKDTIASFGSPLYGLRVSGDMILWILADAEGNGPGHLEIQQS